MTDLDGGRLVAKALKDEGVDVVFTLCGGHIMPIYEGCLDQGIRVVDVRHEQAAAMAGDGYARATQGPGVALVTAGPGVMNAVTGVANAQRSDSPLVTLGGASDLARFEHGSLQEGPQVPVLAPLTKWSRTCFEARRLPDYTHAAVRQAMAPRTGPTFLEVPWDVLYDEAPEPLAVKGRRRIGHGGSADPDGLKQAADLLAAAERPVVIAGGSVWWSRGTAALQAFADQYEAPVFLTGLSRGALSPRHPHFFARVRGKALEKCDLLLNVGAPFDFRLNHGEGLPADCRVIHADVDAVSIGQVRSVDVGLSGNLGAILQDLGTLLKGRPQNRKAWLSELREKEMERKAQALKDAASDGNPIHAQRLLQGINDALTSDTIFVGDGGNVVALAGKGVEVHGPGHWMDPGPYGTLGVGLPFGMAAKLAHPKKRVLVLSGDGAFGLNGFEFDTLVRHNLPVVTVIGNDGAWNQIREPQKLIYGEDRAITTLLGNKTRYDLLAEALGGHGEYVTEPGEVTPAIERAFASGKPAIVNVLIDRDTNKGSGKPM